MANSFTGLKLQGLIGHFGKTTATDIEGYMELPDGKVCVLLFLVWVREAWKCVEQDHIFMERSIVFTGHKTIESNMKYSPGAFAKTTWVYFLVTWPIAYV